MPRNPPPVAAQPPVPQPLPRSSANCRVWLLGTLEVEVGAQRLARLPGRAVAALLARLALYPQRLHPREELIELLWPGVALDAGRNRLRQALSVLRGLIETPEAGAVIEADRHSVRALPGAIDCDATRFEALARVGRGAEALALYRGELMPGHYDDWIAHERLRLEALAEGLGDAAGVLPVRPGPAAPAAGPGPWPATPADETSFAAPAASLSRAADVRPASRTTDAAPTTDAAYAARPSLPRYLTRLHGAEAACTALADTVRGARLVTLLGPGGSGKTRLAVEAATRLRDAGTPFDLVTFVPLVACTDADAVVDALLHALRQPRRLDDPATQLAELLQGRRVLLVLDNAEQVAEAAAPVLATLLEATDGLHLLVTSRHALGLDGEVQQRIAPLALPQPPASASASASATPLTSGAAAATASSAAVALFVDRARAARSDFHLGPRHAAAVVELVHLLEGMPLAIELAAARVRSLPPPVLVQRLREARNRPGGAALELLARSGPRSGSDPRHASMLKVIDWSWQLLAPAERTLLATIAVCPGGFGLETAQALLGEPPADADATLLCLDALVGHSLLRSEEIDGQPRWWPYELIREYALQQLGPAEADGALRRLLGWLQRWAEALPADASQPLVRAELPNVAAAAAHALSQGQAGAVVALLLAMQAAISDMALPPGLLATLDAAVEAVADDGTPTQALAHLALMRAGLRAGDPAATDRHAAAALARLPAAGLPRAQVLARVAHMRWRRFRERSVEPQLHEALALARAAGALSLQASAMTTLGALARAAGQHAESVQWQRQALAAWTAAGDGPGRLTGQTNLVLALSARRDDCAEALALGRQLLQGTRAAQDWGRHAMACNNLGEVQCRLRQWADAAASYREALAVAWRALDSLVLAYALWNLPYVLARLRQPAASLRLAAAAGRLWHERVSPLSASDRRDLARMRRLAAVQLSAAEAAGAWAEGEAMSLAEAVAAAEQTPPDPRGVATGESSPVEESDT